MRVLVLTTHIPPNAPPDLADSAAQVDAATEALKSKGHDARAVMFEPDPLLMKAVIAEHQPDVVFNLVESVWDKGYYSVFAPLLLRDLNVKFTGGTADMYAVTEHKVQAKRILRMAGLPTPDWALPPNWDGFKEGTRYIIKAFNEDASLGLDDNSIVTTKEAATARHAHCMATFGGRWYAEEYVHGREFNVGLVEQDDGRPMVLPIAEMMFEDWAEERPKVVGYDAKWTVTSADYKATHRAFGWDRHEPRLARSLETIALRCWDLYALRSYARVDFRVDEMGRPFILETNCNPCIEPDAGFPGAAEQAGMTYADLIEHIARTALKY
jgi:D-alanine-D-alanine ligase